MTGIAIHNVVELLQDAPGWPAGTRGTVADLLDGNSLLVEIAAPDGSALDLLELPPSGVRLIADSRPHEQRDEILRGLAQRVPDLVRESTPDS